MSDHADGTADSSRELLAALEKLGDFKRLYLRRRPSDRELAKHLGRSPSTVGDWLRGTRMPQTVEAVLTMTALIEAEASRCGILNDQTAAFLDPKRWEELFTAERDHRAQRVREEVERAQARRALAEDERRARLAALPDPPRPVSAWTPQRLGVHPAIPGRPPTGRDVSGFVLPTYVERPHDTALRSRMATAIAEEECLLVLVRGGSCTGKTRTAYEAIRATAPQWDLLFPADPDSVLAALAASAAGPRTVLWLNEAHTYLYGPAGEAAAAALLRRLDQPGPVLIVATLWPEHDRELTARPAPGGQDPHPHARALLAQAHRIEVPSSFAGHLDATRALARTDPSLAAAVEADGPELTQILAAGPDLVDHYENPVGDHGPYGQAVVSAAMDLRRLGVTSPLPLAFLEEAAPGYLTDAQRAAADPGTWFTEALRYARTRVKHVASALQDVPAKAGMGCLPGVVHLADYLAQHARTSRSVLCPPASTFEAAARHLTTSLDLVQLAEAAEKRGRYRHAARLYRRAADTGARWALRGLAVLRERTGDGEGAEELAWQAEATTGHHWAVRDIVRFRDGAGDGAGAERLAREAAATGDTDVLASLVGLRERAGDGAGAERLAREAADAGDTRALVGLALVREAAGGSTDADPLYQEAAAAGDAFASAVLAAPQELGRHRDDTERPAGEATNAARPSALATLSRLREESGDRLHLVPLSRVAIDAGCTEVTLALLGLPELTARSEGQPQHDAKDVDAQARSQEQAGDMSGEERLAAWEVVDAADMFAVLTLAASRERAGDSEGAEQLARAAAAGGNPYPFVVVAAKRESAGDVAGAERVAREAASAGSTFALRVLARMRQQADDVSGAERLYREAADTGDTFALVSLAELREETGDASGAERLAQEAARAEDPRALKRLAGLREQAGDVVAAERLYRQAVNAGAPEVLEDLARLWQNEPRGQEVVRYGLEPDGRPSDPW